MNSIIVSTWAAMADIKFHGDVIFLFSRLVVVGCCRDDETCKCSALRTYVENIIPSMRGASKISLEGAPSAEI
jgi:hypothetical protein